MIAALASQNRYFETSVQHLFENDWAEITRGLRLRVFCLALVKSRRVRWGLKSFFSYPHYRDIGDVTHFFCLVALLGGFFCFFGRGGK